MSAITQIALAHPDMSWRRNRSPKTVISNQNHNTKINIDTTSARKLEKVKPPENSMLEFLHQRRSYLGSGINLRLSRVVARAPASGIINSKPIGEPHSAPETASCAAGSKSWFSL